jgi:polyhydroxyalkanoate synthase
MYALMDSLRQAQGNALGAFGFGPAECRYRILARGPHWRLRGYDGPAAGPSLLVVPAPIKRPYIWDLTPAVSAIRYCLCHRLRVYLVEWLAASDAIGDAGLDEYADQAIAAAVEEVTREAKGEKPFLMGHSLGGTLAAIFAALNPQSVRGLVLLGSPLCFHQGASSFRDAVVSMAPSGLPETGAVPGSLLSQLSALASPATFVWSRLADVALSVTDPDAMSIQTRIERWTLDETPLPGKLVHQLLLWLYRENRFCRGALLVRDRAIGPSSLQLPALMVVNTSDEIAPPASVMPFIEGMGCRDVRLVEYPGETGVGLQHLAVLVGRQAFARVWPEIMSWVKERC